MEKLPENPSKILYLKGLLNLPKRVRRWDLLMVDDHGKVMAFQHIKGLVIFFMIVLLLSLSVSVFLFCRYKNTQEKMGELQNVLEISRKNAAVMQQEMRDLMVCLAESQSKLPKRKSQKVSKAEKKAPDVIKIQPPPVIPHVEAKTGNLRRTAETRSESPGTGPATAMMKMKVGVFDFSAVHDTALNIIRVRFIIKNINRNISEIQGHIFALMKTDVHDQKGWLLMPAVDLISGKPASIKAGRLFKIRNYKTVELRSETVTGPKTFNRVSVLIYSTKGDLLLEKTYRVVIDVAGNVEKGPPPAVPDTVLQKQEESPPEKPVATSHDLIKTDMETSIPNPAQEKDPGEEPVEAVKE